MDIKLEKSQTGQEDEETAWKNFSAQQFLKGYCEYEPEYTEADIKEPNPEYKKRREDNT